MKAIKLTKYLNLIFQTPDNTGSWFGYYNYDTLNSNQTKMLSHRTNNDAQPIKHGMEVELGYYDIPSGAWHKFATSDSYSWQQGAMLQWLPGNGNESKVIYNTSDGKKNISIIQDIETGETKIIDKSIYCVTPNGKKAISLLMERSHWCRAYHYESIADPKYEGRVYKDDGIYEIDLIKNKFKRIVTIQDVIEIDSEPYFNSAKHWLEHIMVSPNGKRFCFLHRFTVGTLNDYETRLFIADIDGSNLQLISGWRKFSWSHFGWRDDDSFAIYSYPSNTHLNIIRKFKSQISHTEKVSEDKSQKIGIFRALYLKLPEPVKKLLRKSKNQKSGYQYYVVKNGCFIHECDINQKIFQIDGHPSFTMDGRYMITDSYPDKNGYQRLIVYNLFTKKSILLAEIYAGLNKQAGSCDLHPKLSRDNNYLVIDTAFNGQHHMMLFGLNWNDIIKEIN